MLDGQSGAPRFYQHLRANERARDDYWGEMIALDPQLRHSATLRGSGIYFDTDYFDLADPGTAEFVAWEKSIAGWRHHMTGYAALGDGRFCMGLSISRSRAAGATPAHEAEAFAAILPDVTRAMQLGFCHAERLEEAYWNGLMAGHAEATALLDERGRLLRANAALERLIAAGLGVDIAGGRIRAGRTAEDAALQRAIATAIDPRDPRSGALSLTRGASRSRLFVTLYPMPRRHRVLAPLEAAAMLTIVDPLGQAPASATLYRQAFGLTARQAELAALLVSGHSIESAAASLDIAAPTARIHLQRAMEKVQVSRQVDLVRLLLRVSRQPG